MSGLTGFLVMLCLLQYADAQITGWTETSFSSVTGTATATLSATVTSKVPENSIAGAPLFNAVAKKTGSGAIVYIIASGNTGSLFEIDTAGAVNLATGKSLDFETTPFYTLQITASETGATGATGTATLTVSIKNVLEFGQTKYDVNMTCGATADTTVGTYIVNDNTASTTVTYAITSGNTNSDFTFNATGVLKVATGKTLSQKTTENYTMVLLATESGAVADAGSTSLDHRGHMRVLCIGGDTGAHFGCGGHCRFHLRWRLEGGITLTVVECCDIDIYEHHIKIWVTHIFVSYV